MPNPLLGVFFHWLGGLASASFYVPFRGVRGWSWEIFWLVGGLFSWIIAPWLFAAIRTHDLLEVLAEAPIATLALCYFFGALWGFGGLTFGLTMRYLGISLGTAIALGLTAAFGTLIPPLVSGQLFGSLIHSTGGLVVLLGVATALLGIAIVGKAGHAKEFEQAALMEMASGGHSDLPRAADFRKGVGVAVFSGIMSSCFAYGLAAGEPLRQLTLAHGTPALAQGLPVLVVVLLGGFTTNAVWCLILILKNRSGRELVGELKVAGADLVSSTGRNYLLCALAGTTWYFQFFFYTMGESQMGRYHFSSWTLHMSSIIIFAALWGLGLREWRGASRRSLVLLTVGLVVLVGSTVVIGSGNALVAHSSITHAAFGQTNAGTPVDLYTLRNHQGMEARIATYGGIVTTLTAPDRKGHYADVVLGYDSLPEYIKGTSYFGAMIGRYGNRIAHGQFTLDGKRYSLATNNGSNSLHGGRVGFDRVVWQVEKAAVTAAGPQLSLTYLSHDGEEGYPGNLNVKAVYTLGEDNSLRLDYTAVTDQDTPVNLTQHTYFNLRGRGDVLGNVLQIPADQFTPVDRTLIPSGELRPVTGTPFDFRQPTAIGARIRAADEQLEFGKGYDHNWVIAKPAGALAVVATAYEPDTGRVLEVSSTEPGVQFYSGNFLDGSSMGKGGWAYARHDGLALEPQHFPDSPNHANFPSVILKPGQTYHNTISYRFSVR